MANVPIRMIAYHHDHLYPLACGDIKPKGIDLTFDRDVPLAALSQDDSTYQAGETSLGLHMLRTSQGPRDWVGLPVFPMRQFRHRCFLVKRGSPMFDLADLKSLEGKRVGLDGWPNSGNTWTRIVLREAGVDIWKINWVIAPVDGPAAAPRSDVPPLDQPSNVTAGPVGKSLVDLTLSGEIDVLVTAFLPKGFYDADYPLVHMLPDYRTAERAYLQRVGYCPAHHMVTVRRSLLERDPWIVRSLFDAFEASKNFWREQRRKLQDTSPWLLTDLEESAILFDGDWNPYGLEPNLKMLTDFTPDQYAQKLVTAAVDPVAAFADFTQMVQS
jgi:4,5-dihydroxyphthalate decarboxylase